MPIDHASARAFASRVLVAGKNPDAQNLAQAYLELVAFVETVPDSLTGPRTSAGRALREIREARSVPSVAGPVTPKGPQRNPHWRRDLNKLRAKLGQKPLPEGGSDG